MSLQDSVQGFWQEIM